MIRPYFHKIHVYITYWVTSRDGNVITSPVRGWQVYHYFIQHTAVCRCIHVCHARIAYTHCISRSWNRNHTRKKYIQVSQILSNTKCVYLITLRSWQNGSHFPDDISDVFSWMTMRTFWLKFRWRSLLWVQITICQHWHRPSDKPLSEQMMVSLAMHICVTRPQWIKYLV